MSKQDKTNVMRALEAAKIPYAHYSYNHDGDTAVDGVTVAASLGKPVEQVFKTLVTRGAGHDYFVFVVPVARELNLKAAAAAVGEKSVEMIHVAEINKVTGYIRGGCSPIGMKKSYRTVIDSSAHSLPTMIFSAGRIGLQVEVDPADLARLTGAQFAPIAR